MPMHSMACKYYPKLLSAIPFTPVSGPRLLVNPRRMRARSQTP